MGNEFKTDKPQEVTLTKQEKCDLETIINYLYTSVRKIEEHNREFKVINSVKNFQRAIFNTGSSSQIEILNDHIKQLTEKNENMGTNEDFEINFKRLLEINKDLLNENEKLQLRIAYLENVISTHKK